MDKSRGKSLNNDRSPLFAPRSRYCASSTRAATATIDNQDIMSQAPPYNQSELGEDDNINRAHALYSQHPVITGIMDLSSRSFEQSVVPGSYRHKVFERKDPDAERQKREVQSPKQELTAREKYIQDQVEILHGKHLKIEAKKRENEYKELSIGFEQIQQKRERKIWQ